MSAASSPTEQLFWQKYAANTDEAGGAAGSMQSVPLPPWIAQMLPNLSESGIAAVAEVIASGTAFRAAIKRAADNKRKLKQTREATYKTTVAELEAKIDAAAAAQDSHAFVSSLRDLRSEVDDCRAAIAKLEGSLSNNQQQGGGAQQQTENTAAAKEEAEEEDPDKKMIDAARESFLAKCNTVMEQWESLVLPQKEQVEKQQQQQQQQKVVRPPWQLMYCADNDPFAPPDSDASKVNFDGGKIIDRFGRDIWEDRCVGLGVTIQSGAEGSGVQRFRSCTHSLVVRSEKWHRWATMPFVQKLFVAGEAKNATTKQVQFHVCDRDDDDKKADAGGGGCSCSILDPFCHDFFVQCDGQRVMTFTDILDAVQQKQSADGKDTKMQLSVLECFERFRNFPLIGHSKLLVTDAAAASASSTTTTTTTTATSKQRNDLSHLFSYANVEQQAVRFLKKLAEMHRAATKSSSSSSSSGLKIVAACVEDCPEWFVMDLACAAAGIVFVGLHTSWPEEDLARALRIVRPDVIICHTNKVEATQRAMKTMLMNDNHNNSNCNIFETEIFVSEMSAAAAAQEAASSPSSSSSSSLRQLVTTEPLFLEAISLPPFKCEPPLSENEVDASTEAAAAAAAAASTRPFTLMFSSGTSGKLKAVEVSAHAWLDTNFTPKYELDPFSVISFNAMAHGLDRGMCWTAFFNTGRISFLRRDCGRDKVAVMAAVAQPQQKDSARAAGDKDVLEAAASLVPDFIPSAAMSHPSVLVATPDAWTSLKHALDAVGFTALVEKTTAPTLQTKQSNNEDDVAAAAGDDADAVASVRRGLQALFGCNVRQAGTGGAPISPAVLTFFRKLFSFSPHPDEALLRKNIAGKLSRGESVEEDVKEPLGVSFVDVYGATEAPGISTDNMLRGTLTVGLLTVPGYDIAAGFGEMIVKGQGVARRYHNAAAGDNESAFLPGGWYRTGDVVHLSVSDPTAAAADGGSNKECFSDLFETVENFAGLPKEQSATAVVVKKSKSAGALGKLRLAVVDRVKDLVELYVDHQSAWVPSTIVEDAVLLHSKNNRNSSSGEHKKHLEIVQTAVYGDRMLPFLVAVVGVAPASIANSGVTTAAEAERDVIAQFKDALSSAAERPAYWVPKVILLHRVVEESSSSAEEEGSAVIPESMLEWRNGSEFRTHLGKLRRGVLGKTVRDKLSAAFVKGQE